VHERTTELRTGNEGWFDEPYEITVEHAGVVPDVPPRWKQAVARRARLLPAQSGIHPDRNDARARLEHAPHHRACAYHYVVPDADHDLRHAPGRYAIASTLALTNAVTKRPQHVS
jgi:hypothetical protein